MDAVIIGFGAMGQKISQLMLTKKGCKIIAIYDKNPLFHGKKISEFIQIEKNNDVMIQQDLNLLEHTSSDIAIITTGSTLENVSPIILKAIQASMNVITIAEEMANPKITSQALADEMDQQARENGVSVLGTGINPGFILDLQILVLSSVCQEVKSIQAVRVNDLSEFGKTVLDSQGVGKTIEQFETGIHNGSIVGHIGFPQSIALIADTFGWEIDEVIEKKEPIVSNVKREHPNFTIQPGMVVGCNHIAIAKRHGEIVIRLEHPQQVLPEAEGIKTKDEIIIHGTPDIEMRILPEVPGGTGTVAIAVNMIPLIMKAKAGLLTMKDLPGIPSLFNGVME